MTCRGWLITLNNPNLLEVREYEQPSPAHKYYAAQLERGKQGTLHIQCYIEFTNPCRLAAVRKLFPRAHAEPRRGTPAEAFKYCTKNESRVRVLYSTDAPKGPGARSDLHSVVEAIQNGATLSDIANEFPTSIIKYSKGITKLRELLTVPRDSGEGIEVVLYWGDTGTGKSRKALEDNPGAYVMPLLDKNLWFHKYDLEETIIIDEFEGEMRLNNLLRVLDRHQLKVPYKGGFIEAKYKKVIITSNSRYEDWYDFTGREVKLLALARRFTEVHHFGFMKTKMVITQQK